MHILILGASGRTGRLTTTHALEKGHSVTALVRDTTSLGPHRNLTLIHGTPLNEPDITSAFAAAPKDHPITAVICSLNASRKSDSPFSAPLAPPMFVRDCVTHAISAMNAHGVKRLVVMSAFGVGSSYAALPYLMRAIFRWTNMRVSIEDHDALDAMIRAEGEGLEWVLVRPARLVEGEGPVREMGEEGRGVGLMGRVGRGGVAGFLVEAAEGKRGARRAVVVAD